MFYCFVYPESIDRILLEYFDKSPGESVVEIMKYKTNDVFYVCKSHTSSMYLPEDRREKGARKETYGKRIGNCGDISSVIGAESLIRSFEVKLCRFGSKLVRTASPWECYDSKIDVLVGKIFSSNGKRMGSFLIYNDNRTKKVLADILGNYEVTETEPTGDMCLDMINLLVKLDKV